MCSKPPRQRQYAKDYHHRCPGDDPGANPRRKFVGKGRQQHGGPLHVAAAGRHRRLPFAVQTSHHAMVAPSGRVVAPSGRRGP